MHEPRPTADVFVSYCREDQDIAATLERVLGSHGLHVFVDAGISSGENIADAVWEAMAESQALVAVAPQGGPTARMMFEMGAAKARNKPVYAVVSEPTSRRLPAALRDVKAYPPARIEEMAQDIKRSSEALSDSEAHVLIDEYHRIGVPVDQLALRPQQLSKLRRQFQKRTKRQIPAEHLLRVLLRLRKQRALPATSRKTAR